MPRKQGCGAVGSFLGGRDLCGSDRVAGNRAADDPVTGCASLRAEGLACLASCNSQGQLHEGRAARSPLLEVRTRDFKEVSNSPEVVNPQS